MVVTLINNAATPWRGRTVLRDPTLTATGARDLWRNRPLADIGN